MLIMKSKKSGIKERIRMPGKKEKLQQGNIRRGHHQTNDEKKIRKKYFR